MLIRIFFIKFYQHIFSSKNIIKSYFLLYSEIRIKNLFEHIYSKKDKDNDSTIKNELKHNNVKSLS